jgi:UDP-N-acetylglucosamine 2-epimerase
MMRVMTLVGARPQFIKASSISLDLKKKHIVEIFVHSGQHYDKNLSDNFFLELNLPVPDYNLNVGSYSHAVQTARVLVEIEKVLDKERPNLLIVYGDTNTTLAGALAASKKGIPIFHIEAGLRCYDKSVPEEVNRLITDHLSHRLFCISKSSVENLELEGLHDGVILSGDVMYDIFRFHEDKVDSHRLNKILSIYRTDSNLDYEHEYNLVTIHREENTRNVRDLSNLLRKINQSKFFSIFPIHPRTYKLIKDKLDTFGNIMFIDPVGYLDMLTLIKYSRLVITDSGGVLREAYFSHKKTITIRDSIEIKETLLDGANILYKSGSVNLTELIDRELDLDEKVFSTQFGYGNASEIIVGEIVKFLEEGSKIDKL